REKLKENLATSCPVRVFGFDANPCSSCSFAVSGFTHFMMFSDWHHITDASHRNDVYQDMTQPITNYWIASSHNTPTLELRFANDLSLDNDVNLIYRIVLLNGHLSLSRHLFLIILQIISWYMWAGTAVGPWRILSNDTRHQVTCCKKHWKNGPLDAYAFGRALLEWRNVPRSDGLSPSQWSFGKSQRTLLPASKSLNDRLSNETINSAEITRRKVHDKMTSKSNEGSKPLSILPIGVKVQILHHATGNFWRAL
ncbi:hypothetical protein TCAL_13633, partial [Tigriopus californicus]